MARFLTPTSSMINGVFHLSDPPWDSVGVEDSTATQRGAYRYVVLAVTYPQEEACRA